MLCLRLACTRGDDDDDDNNEEEEGGVPIPEEYDTLYLSRLPEDSDGRGEPVPNPI